MAVSASSRGGEEEWKVARRTAWFGGADAREHAAWSLASLETGCAAASARLSDECPSQASGCKAVATSPGGLATATVRRESSYGRVYEARAAPESVTGQAEGRDDCIQLITSRLYCSIQLALPSHRVPALSRRTAGRTGSLLLSFTKLRKRARPSSSPPTAPVVATATFSSSTSSLFRRSRASSA